MLPKLLVNILIGSSLLAASTSAWGYDLGLAELRSVTLGSERYIHLRDPYMPQFDNDWEYGAWLGLDINLVRLNTVSLYYSPILSFRSANSQIREGALNYRGGIRWQATPQLLLNGFAAHESRHCLECNELYGTGKRYPLMDSWGMEIEWRPGR